VGSNNSPHALETYVGFCNSISVQNVSPNHFRQLQKGAYSSLEQIDENNLIINEEI
jgi:hypothetical protein